MAYGEQTSAMLRTSELARLLNVHVNTVRRWSNEGILKAYRIGRRGDRRFLWQEISAVLIQSLKNDNSRGDGKEDAVFCLPNLVKGIDKRINSE